MADREVEDELNEIPEIDETLESVLLYSLKDAKQKMEAGEEVVPFTALAVKENLFIETHPADDTDECFNLARHTVQGARGASAYAFCYDGYVDTDAGTKDVIIAEGGIPGDPAGYAIGYLYEMGEGEDAVPQFESEPVYIGPAPNFMAFLLEEEEEEEADEELLEEEEEAEATEAAKPEDA